MVDINFNNPLEIQAVGIKALEDALGVIGAAKFIMQNNLGFGDYTEEKYTYSEPSREELREALKSIQNEKNE